MDKIEKGYIINSSQDETLYADSTTETIGLWQSEKYAIEKYFSQADSILDIGCSSGRTTFALHKNGYHNITGLDLSPSKIQEAKKISYEENVEIPFILGDAKALPFDDSSFDKALFTVNGLMKIPQRKNRTLALKEIHRTLRPDGILIFTTHDRDSNESYLNFWEQEEMIWCESLQDDRLYEFGDIVTPTKPHQKEAYLHIPNQQEVLDCLEEANLTVLETFYRSELFNESEAIINMSSDCRFWIVQK